ncbi:hypothetical protein D5b_00132 [Faustovirus]|nr:hypothetical protein D5b_00132 [Faustovirus]AMN84779.1 hypothetical protein D6_00379 [Faustovirus]AMP44089.1 hypothetical protein PRJ_Dakar_00130 [Faustovirus]
MTSNAITTVNLQSVGVPQSLPQSLPQGSGQRAPRSSHFSSYTPRANPFTTIKQNVKCDIDNPTDVKAIKHAPSVNKNDNKTANWRIVIGVVNARQGPYVALGAFSFSDEKMPKKGKERVITLPNGDKCALMDTEVRFKVQTASGLIGTIQRMFPGSQRPVKKGQFITNIVPTPAQLNSLDDSDPAFNSIREFPQMVKYVYIKLIKEIQKFYRVRVELSDVLFESPYTYVSPIQSLDCSPLSSQGNSPLSSPTKSPVAAPSFADAVKNNQPDFVMVLRDNTKVASTNITTDEPKIRTDIPSFYIIDARNAKLIDLGPTELHCPRK